MTHSKFVAYSLLLFGVVLWAPSNGMAQTATPWTDAQCRARMEQLFQMAHDPSVDINAVMQDVGERAGSSFAVYCRLKEANSIKILQNQLANIEADRRETAASDTRTDRLGRRLENFNAQTPTYDPYGYNFGHGR